MKNTSAMFTATCGGKMFGPPSIFNFIRRADEMNNQSTVPGGLGSQTLHPAALYVELWTSKDSLWFRRKVIGFSLVR